MTDFKIKNLIIRSLREGDIDRVVEIDAEVLGQKRLEYYKRKCAFAIDSTHQLVTSLVAENEGQIIGFIMGNLYTGEYGIPEATASLDTIGVSPDYQGKGIGSELIKTYIDNMKKAGVDNIHIRVDWNDWNMLRTFEKFGFVPNKTVNMELKIT